MERDTFLLQAANVEGPRIFYKNDRLLIFPSKKELQYSTNGVNLLMNIGLPRIWVDPVHNAVKMNGGRVQLCINGQKAGDKEVLSLLPKEISRIEYSDNLNLRYKDADVVINYVTKKMLSGGLAAVDYTQVLPDRSIEGNFAAKLNLKRSAWEVMYHLSTQNLKETEEGYDKFVFPQEIRYRDYKSDYFRTKKRGNGLVLNYKNQKENDYYFNISLRGNKNYEPYYEKNSWMSATEWKDSICLSEGFRNKSHDFSLDLYLDKQINGKSSLIVDILGTYMDAGINQYYRQQNKAKYLSGFVSLLDGKRYSLILQAVYERKIAGGKWMAGVKYNQSYTSLHYDGTVKDMTNVREAEGGLFTQYMGHIRRFIYAAGLEGNFSRRGQKEKVHFDFYMSPVVQLQYRLNETSRLAYRLKWNRVSPGAGLLSDAKQYTDDYQLKQGNSGLKPYTKWDQQLSYTLFQREYSIGLNAQYIYSKEPVMEQSAFEDGFFVTRNANQKNYQCLTIVPSFKWEIVNNYLTVNFDPGLKYTLSRGNDYIHTKWKFCYNAQIIGVCKDWMLVLQAYGRDYTLWGENLTLDNADAMCMVQYKHKNFAIAGGANKLFSYTRKSGSYERLSCLVSTYSQNEAKGTPHIFLKFSYNFLFGKQLQSASKKINNSDKGLGL